MIDLDEREDICDIFIENAVGIYGSEETVAVIANKELVNYIVEELFKFDWATPKKIDFDEDDLEYMVSINGDGYVVAMPIESFKDKYFADIDVVYISMDNDVSQDIIDKCVDMDKDVALFGLEDEECTCKFCEEYNYDDIKDEELAGFTHTVDDENGYATFAYYSSNSADVRKVLDTYIDMIQK